MFADYGMMSSVLRERGCSVVWIDSSLVTQVLITFDRDLYTLPLYGSCCQRGLRTPWTLSCLLAGCLHLALRTAALHTSHLYHILGSEDSTVGLGTQLDGTGLRHETASRGVKLRTKQAVKPAQTGRAHRVYGQTAGRTVVRPEMCG